MKGSCVTHWRAGLLAAELAARGDGGVITQAFLLNPRRFTFRFLLPTRYGCGKEEIDLVISISIFSFLSEFSNVFDFSSYVRSL